MINMRMGTAYRPSAAKVNAFNQNGVFNRDSEFYKSKPLLQPVMDRLYQGSIGGVLGQLPEHRSGQPFCLEITHLERNRRWIVVRPVSAAVEHPGLLRNRIADLPVPPPDPTTPGIPAPLP